MSLIDALNICYDAKLSGTKITSYVKVAALNLTYNYEFDTLFRSVADKLVDKVISSITDTAINLLGPDIQKDDVFDSAKRYFYEAVEESKEKYKNLRNDQRNKDYNRPMTENKIRTSFEIATENLSTIIFQSEMPTNIANLPIYEKLRKQFNPNFLEKCEDTIFKFGVKYHIYIPRI